MSRATIRGGDAKNSNANDVDNMGYRSKCCERSQVIDGVAYREIASAAKIVL
jgi:hypothetical protein